MSIANTVTNSYKNIVRNASLVKRSCLTLAVTNLLRVPQYRFLNKKVLRKSSNFENHSTNSS